jgi:hypothetical protein
LEQINYRKIHNFYKPAGSMKKFIKLLLKRNKHKFYYYWPTAGKKDNLVRARIKINNIKSNKNESLFVELLKYDFIWIYLHGSQADNTSTAFSDYDDLIIIDTAKFTKSNINKIKKALMKIDLRFCKNDFLQHHGHWIITRQMLLNYDASYMPLSVLNKSNIISGPSEIDYALNKTITNQGLKKNIINTIKYIKIFYSKFAKNRINIYNLKRLAGNYVLIPPMLFQLKNIYINKAEAIKMSNKLFSPQAMKCIEWSTYCRDNWQNIFKFRSVRLFKILRYLFTDPFRYRRFAERYSPVINLSEINFHWLSDDNSQRFCEETLKLVENAI